MTAHPNIVWVTLDSVRFDHTIMGDYRRDTTPNLQRISEASNGTSFSNCVAHSNWTRTSTASIITGTCPFRHGVLSGTDTIPDELDTVAERFAKQGYRTASFSRNVNSTMGFDRGFDTFEWISASTFHDAVPLYTAVKYALNVRRHSAGFTTDTAKHATPFVLNDMTKSWLRDVMADDDPFFCYLHYNEPHRPYYPPLPYLDEYTDDIEMSTKEAAEFAMSVHYNLVAEVAEGLTFTDDEWRALKAMYDAEIAYTDEMVGRLFDYVQSQVGDNIIFVVTADHGELFGERGLLAHKIVLHDALVNVPLVVHGLDGLDSSDALIQHSDVMAALLSKAGGRTDQIQGFDPRMETREFAVSQRGNASFDAFLEHNSDFDTSRYHRPALSALRTRKFKYQRSDADSELYELPDEDTDISDERQETAQRFDAELTDWLEREAQPVSGSADVEVTDAMEKQLRDLGYLP